MSLKITYFVHGTTTDNENGIATGCLDGELSELGIKQSKELGILVKREEFDAVISSDLQRAIDSASLAFGKKREIITDRRLREIDYGKYNGKPDNFKNNLIDYIDKPFPDGESYQDVERRIKEFLEYWTKKYNNKRIAVVSHQAPQLALEVICNKKSWEEAIEEDWRRKENGWQAGWKYTVSWFERKK
jgi:alpha-ribazole phosphatase/probable phosphoglycerate mutase